jgi:hypothetical protein
MKASFQRDFGKINDPAAGGVHEGFAERGGFEPPVPLLAEHTLSRRAS